MSTINRVFRPVGRKGDSLSHRHVVVSKPQYIEHKVVKTQPKCAPSVLQGGAIRWGGGKAGTF